MDLSWLNKLSHHSRTRVRLSAVAALAQIENRAGVSEIAKVSNRPADRKESLPEKEPNPKPSVEPPAIHLLPTMIVCPFLQVYFCGLARDS